MSTDGPTIPTIQTDRGEWLRWDLARSLATEVSTIRDELAELQERFSRVMRDVRRLPGGEFQYQRIDAYPGTRAMEGGTAAPEDFGLDDATDCDGFTGENAWGPCTRCGKRLEDHDA